MNKVLLVILIQIILCVNVKSQSDQQSKIGSLKMELARLENCNDFFSKYKGIVVNHRYEGDKAIIELNGNISQSDFVKFCQDYRKSIVDYERNLKDYPAVTHNHIIFSTGEQNNKMVINTYYETVPNLAVPLKVMNSDIKQYEANAERIKEYQLQLEKIRNTKKLYQDLSNALQHQINYNLVETADNAGDLLLKHVSIPEGDVLKAKAMGGLRKETGVDNEKPIKNEFADIVNSVIEGSEKIIDLVPGGDIITDHYLWKLFKSTPEAGKGLGHLAASINIYFRKNEYESKIKELDNMEQQLVKSIEENKAGM